jgi:hypothetical protein
VLIKEKKATKVDEEVRGKMKRKDGCAGRRTSGLEGKRSLLLFLFSFIFPSHSHVMDIFQGGSGVLQIQQRGMLFKKWKKRYIEVLPPFLRMYPSEDVFYSTHSRIYTVLHSPTHTCVHMHTHALQLKLTEMSLDLNCWDESRRS